MTENTAKIVEVETFGNPFPQGIDLLETAVSNAKTAKPEATKGVANLIRPRLTTEELAALLHVKPQTVRAGLCRSGHYLGLRPAVKLPNRRLLWDAHHAASVLNA